MKPIANLPEFLLPALSSSTARHFATTRRVARGLAIGLCALMLFAPNVSLARAGQGTQVSDVKLAGDTTQPSSRRTLGLRVAQGFQKNPRSASPLDPPPTDPKRLTTNLRGFGVPFKIDANDGAFIEVQLYLSTDQGKSWRFYGRQKTNQEEFAFQAEEDGEYWFALKTLNRDRQLLPSGDPQPELKIIVDSKKPVLDFRIQTDSAGRVICRWQAKDPNLLAGSLKMFYQPIQSDGTLKRWVRVPVELRGQVRNGVYSDQIGWWPETTESMVNVAVEIQDAAGNTTRVDRRVALPQTAWRNRNVATARPQPATSRQINDGRTITAKPAAGATSTPVQPDWAEPNWPSNQGPLNQNQPPQIKTMTPLNNNTAQLPGDRRVPAKPVATASNAQATHPPNVVCENGICRIVGDGDGMFDKPQPQQVPQVAAKPPSRFGGAGFFNRSGRRPIRTANQSGQNFPLIGSREEFVDPPVPPGYQPPEARVAQQQTSPSPQRPVHWNNQPPTQASAAPQQTPTANVWQSEQKKWPPHNQHSTASTTRRIDPSITPRAKEIPISPSTFVPSNPSTMQFEGDRVISQSSTIGPNNQYRGIKPTSPRLPQPELLPGQNTQPKNTQQNSNTIAQYAKTNAAPFQESQGTVKRLGGDKTANPNGHSTPFQEAGFQRNQSRLSTGPLNPKPLRETNAPVNFISTKRFRLPYGIDSIDPSGVGRIDLWMTRDDGKTWNNWGTDPDSKSPFPVEVQDDGRYGFRIVVQSKEGLAGLGPSSGDDADIWVNVDSQSPLVQIKSVPYGRGSEIGTLVINYAATDNYLTLKPISLAYAASPMGPWNEIESGLRNEGRYVWKVDPQAPANIYLRIEAIDQASNVGRHLLSQPVDISGLAPSGSIHGVTPVGK